MKPPVTPRVLSGGPRLLPALVFCAGTVGLVSGCQSPQTTYHPPQRPGPVYDTLYPLYVQLCAVSQIRAKFAAAGGTPGHAVMYLKGACRDDAYPYPRIKLCDAGSDHTGVGISVNKVFKNVNWTAVPGKELFFHGNLEPGEFLEADEARAAIRDAADGDVFEGVEIHEQYQPSTSTHRDLERFLAKETLGTDFALTFGRTVYCANMPVTRPVLSDIVDWLNALNEKYADGEATYNWSGYSDNCVHTVRNALAAGRVWAPKSINRIKLLQLFHLAIPANEFAELAFRTNRFEIEDFDRVYDDPHMREALLRYGWLPAAHGAMLEYIPVHQNNVLYDVRHRIFVLETPLFRPKSRRVSGMLDMLRYTDVEENLNYYRSRYENIWRNRPADWDQTSDDDERARVRRAYYRYVQSQLADVTRKLNQIKQ